MKNFDFEKKKKNDDFDNKKQTRTLSFSHMDSF